MASSGAHQQVRFICVCLALALVAPQVALAAPSAADRETARTLMDEGKKRRDKGDLKGALESFKAADAIMRVPTTGLFVARTEASLGLLVEARDTALRVTRIPEEKGEPMPFQEARAAADELAAQLAPRIPTVKITTLPAGQRADVSIDDEAIPFEALQAPRKVNPGHHVIVARLGDAQKKAEVDVVERDAKEVTINLPPPPKTATIVSSNAQDGKTLEAGRGGKKTSPLAYVGFGLAGAGLVVGSVTGILTLSKKSSLETGCPNSQCPPSQHDALDGANTMATISTISFAAAGVGAVLGVVGIVISPKADKENGNVARGPAFVLAPSAMLGGGGVAASGTF